MVSAHLVSINLQKFPHVNAAKVRQGPPKNKGRPNYIFETQPTQLCYLLTVETPQNERNIPSQKVTLTRWWLNQPSEKYARQIGNLPQVGVKIKNIWNHHPVKCWLCWKFNYLWKHQHGAWEIHHWKRKIIWTKPWFFRFYVNLQGCKKLQKNLAKETEDIRSPRLDWLHLFWGKIRFTAPFGTNSGQHSHHGNLNKTQLQNYHEHRK